ncbi:Hypothetical predicted protein [Podarcis lilfordi]|uniref:UPAR/Ly6 domain-containing protein n=1 Tax=Podarcis lilfordi TaxID=74358 RepID=A0AA35VPJ0_9SAUR|nr:Hypothetical predicted protein [Podarcis lilfordi]
MRSFTKCCQTLFCNKKSITHLHRQLNGLTCPILGPSGPVVSERPKPIRCYGDETRCLEFVLVRDDSEVPNEVVRACATPSFCEMAKMSMHIDAISGTITEARCCESVRSEEQLNIEG